MKIERDKWYVDGCGNKQRVVCIDAPSDYPVISVDAGGEVNYYTAEGYYCFEDGPGSRNDLISEYVEPPKPREVWVEVSNPKRAGTAWFDHEKARLADNDLAAKLVKFREVIEA